VTAPDIFLSYNREDAATARVFADAFAEAGLEVWWDAALRSGESYDEVTEAALREARAVVVLWSPRSVVSRWVRAEATVADRNGTMVPVTVDACERPIMFELTQTADLIHWQGDTGDTAWQAFVDQVRHFVGGERDLDLSVVPAGKQPPMARETLLAVLAFDNLSNDPELSYFSDGVSEEILYTVARTKGLRVLVADGELEALRMLTDRRDELAHLRVQTVNRLQRLLSELFPGQRKKDLSALQAKAMLATVRPADIAGKTRRRMAAEELADLVVVDGKLKKIKAELKAMVIARGSTLLQIHGIGPTCAARTLADVGDITRFADRNRFASWTGTAPLDASSGEQIRHRLSRAGNRRMNHVLHMAAIVQLRHDTEGRAYFRRKVAAGKTRMEALRCLKRRLSDVLYRRLVADAKRQDLTAGETGPGGHCGATQESSAADLSPHVGTSDKPLPGPATATLQRPIRTRKTARPRVPQPAS